jgi:hypothetical protein
MLPDHDGAVAASMRAQIGDRRIACKRDRAERKVMFLKARQDAPPIETGNAEARPHRWKVGFVETGLRHRLEIGLLNGVQSQREADARVGGPTLPRADHSAVRRHQPRPGVRAAGIYAEVEFHDLRT